MNSEYSIQRNQYTQLSLPTLKKVYCTKSMDSPSKSVSQLTYSDTAKIQISIFPVKFSQNRKELTRMYIHVYLQTILWIHKKISSEIIKHDGVFAAILLKLSPNDT